ncbi:MAG: hypothetical protein KGH58_04030, partial [Candidatus Micrarchaeota archaeon]|nr:hypothetical protein [Candidatus Micrarchaeota archaeon]
LSERNAAGIDASTVPRLDYRNRHGFIVKILRKADEGVSLERLSKSLDQSMGKIVPAAKGLQGWGMLRQEGAIYATTDKGRDYATAVGIMNAILDRSHHPDAIPGLASRIESLIPNQRSSVYDYGESGTSGGNSQSKRMLTRSRINITHDVLTAMASSPMTRNGIRKVARFDSEPEGVMELEWLMETLISTKLITKANVHQSTTEAYRITDSGWRVKNALGGIISATSG